MPRPTVEDLARAYETARNHISKPEWAHSVDAQLGTLELLQRRHGGQLAYDALHPSQRQELCERIAAKKGWRTGSGTLNVRHAGALFLLRTPEGKPDLTAQRIALQASTEPVDWSQEGGHLMPRTGWLGAYIEYAHYNESPLGYHFWVGITTLLAALKRNVLIDRGFQLSPNPYVWLVGPTGNHKNTALRNGKAILRKMNRMIEVEQWNQAKMLVTTVADPLDDKRLTIMRPKISPEKLIENLDCTKVYTAEYKDPGMAPQTVYMRHDSVGAVFNPEASTWLGDDTGYASRLTKDLTDLFDGEEDVGSDTLRRGTVTLNNPTLTVLLGSTEEWIKRHMTGSMFRGGFLNRWMFVKRGYSGKCMSRAGYMDPISERWLAEKLKPWAILDKTITAELTTPAEHYFDTWYRHNDKLKRDPTTPEAMRNYYVRKQLHLLRLALALTVSKLLVQPPGEYAEVFQRGSLSIEKEAVEQAVELLAYEERFLPEAFADMVEMTEPGKLEYLMERIQKIVRSQGWGFPRHILTKRLNGNLVFPHSKDYLPYLQQLEEIGKVRLVGGHGKGAKIEKGEEL